MAEPHIPRAILIDTSIVVRYLIGDPPEAAARAASIVDGSETAIVPDIVLVETAHVLRSVYQAYGKGRHPAALDVGDCLTYGTAALAGLPPLCVGSDFGATDLELA